MTKMKGQATIMLIKTKMKGQTTIMLKLKQSILNNLG